MDSDLQRRQHATSSDMTMTTCVPATVRATRAIMARNLDAERSWASRQRNGSPMILLPLTDGTK